MALSYKPLWHLLIERNMNRSELIEKAGITSNVMARMGKDGYISMESLEKICLALNCQVSDVVEIIKEDTVKWM